MNTEIIDFIEKYKNKQIETKVNEMINEINKVKDKINDIKYKDYENLPEDLQNLQNKYNFSDEIILEMLKYCSYNNAVYINYLKSIADEWHSKNVKITEDLKRLKIIK